MRPRGALILAMMALTFVAARPTPASADPVAVKFTEGVARGFPVLRGAGGDILAHGDLVQIPSGDRVHSRLVFRFRDGSLYDEAVTFSQRDVFTLMTYRIVQRGPSFPETIDASVDRATGRYHVRYRADEDSPEEVLTGQTDLPADVSNGLLGMLLKNLEPGTARMVTIVAFTPRPRTVKMLLQPMAAEPIAMGGMPVLATRYHITPQLGLFAAMLVTDLPDVKTWIAQGTAPAFLRFEGPLYLMGPVWRIDWN